MKTLLLALPILLILVLAIVFAVSAWNLTPGQEVPFNGYAALAIGIVVSLALGGGLILLLLRGGEGPDDGPADRDI